MTRAKQATWLLTGCTTLFMLGSVAQAGIAAQDFANPTYKGHLLDWCKTWATDCGKPVADAYCVNKGFDKSGSFTKLNNPGQSTRLIGSNQVCDEEECDSFTTIQCHKVSDAPEPNDEEDDEITYHKPKAGGRRLDWCLTWATDCGQKAANYFCKSKGQNTAIDFKIAEDIGKTRILKTGQKCTEPACDGFKYITCQD